MHQDGLQDEIHCLEETLAKRRAELRQADRLLQECQQDYQLVHTKVRIKYMLESVLLRGIYIQLSHVSFEIQCVPAGVICKNLPKWSR